ncbi:hypothetical protein BJY00DRAFT_10242 [Aspergillus carlsbadensis]|nr:hypothetical protein BJY00DRAFT_10242 [Aspergillus carlsbadensis]
MLYAPIVWYRGSLLPCIGLSQVVSLYPRLNQSGSKEKANDSLLRRVWSKPMCCETAILWHVTCRKHAGGGSSRCRTAEFEASEEKRKMTPS